VLGVNKLGDSEDILKVTISDWIRNFKICASNDINEEVLKSLNDQKHSIDMYGIGTNLVTCQAQPALGMVYKLVELEGEPRIKLSEEYSKVSVPCKKQVYRLYGTEGIPLIDLMLREGDDVMPQVGKKVYCRHTFDETKRCYVTPSKVEPLLQQIWGAGCDPVKALVYLEEARSDCMDRLKSFRQDHLRPQNPTPYKRSITDSFFHFFKELWEQQAPVKDLS